MTRNYFAWLVLVGLLAVAIPATAATFPVPELGNCRDQKECRLFCDVPENHAACWSYQQYSNPAGLVLAETTGSDTQLQPVAATIFPIAELGNCADAQACKAYCDDPSHFAACTEVAKKHGLTRAATAGQQTALLAHAKAELGCTSLAQCRAFCAEPANAQQCHEVAFKYGTVKYRMAQEKLLRNARANLGCQTVSDCRLLCANPANQDQCRAFTKTKVPLHLLRKMQKAAESANTTAPLPCTTLAECQTYCSDPANATACEMSGKDGRLRINLQQPATFTCTTTEECERYCQANPDRCPRYKESADYQSFILQKEQRATTQSGAPVRKDINLERYRQSLIQKKSASYSPTVVPPVTTTQPDDGFN